MTTEYFAVILRGGRLTHSSNAAITIESCQKQNNECEKRRTETAHISQFSSRMINNLQFSFLMSSFERLYKSYLPQVVGRRALKLTFYRTGHVTPPQQLTHRPAPRTPCAYTYSCTLSSIIKNDLPAMPMGVALCAASVALVVAVVASDVIPKRKELNFVTLAPYPKPSPFTPAFDGGPALIPAVRLAVEQINNRTDVLPDHAIHLLEANSGCNIASEALIGFVQNVFTSGKNIAGIIGPSCTGATSSLAPILERVELIQVSSATSPDLLSANYRNTFRTVRSSLVYVESFLQLIERNDWSIVGSLFDEERLYFKATHNTFAERLPKDVLQFISPVLDGDRGKFFPMMALQESRVRVIFAFLSARTVRRLLCLAFHSNLLFPQIQWVFIDRTLSQLQSAVDLTLDRVSYVCSTNDMLQALDGAILNVYDLARDKNNSTSVSGLTYDQYRAEYETKYQEHLRELNRNSSTMSVYSNVFYDSTWALSLALDSASRGGLDLDTYTYGQPESTALVREHLLKVNFSGVSGLIQFNATTKESKTNIDISQLCYDSENTSIHEIPLGIFNGTLNMNDNGTFINATFDKQYLRANKILGSAVISITLMIALCTVAVHIATIWFNQYPTVKATSPNMSTLIFSGCYLLIISVVLLAIMQTFEFSGKNDVLAVSILCNLETWSTCIAFSLIFGTICAKTWRVYRIFRHFKNAKPSKFLTDNALIVFVVTLAVADFVICMAWTLTDPWILKSSETVIETKESTPIILIQSKCQCDLLIVWVGIFVAYKGTITITVVSLSILNRRIHRKEFKQTKNINILVYVITLIDAVGYPLYFILEKNHNTSFVILCVTNDLTVVLCLALVFLPPLVPILKAKLTARRSQETTRFYNE